MDFPVRDRANLQISVPTLGGSSVCHGSDPCTSESCSSSKRDDSHYLFRPDACQPGLDVPHGSCRKHGKRVGGGVELHRANLSIRERVGGHSQLYPHL